MNVLYFPYNRGATFPYNRRGTVLSSDGTFLTAKEGLLPPNSSTISR